MSEPCRHERAAAQLKTSLSLMDDEVLMHSSNALTALEAMHRAEDLIAIRDATIERVRVLGDEFYALSMETITSDATLAERYLRICAAIRAALDAPTEPTPELERESDTPTPIGTSTTGPGRLVGYGNTSTSSGYKRTFHGNSVTG